MTAASASATATAAVRRAFPDIAKPIVAAAPVIVALAVALGLGLTGHAQAANGVAVAAAVALGLALHVDLPWGGRLTLGHAVLVVLVARADPAVAVGLAIAGVVLSVPAWIDHHDEGSLLVRIGGAFTIVAATLAAVGARVVVDLVVGSRTAADPDIHAIAVAGAVGVVLLAVDHVGRALLARQAGDRSDLRQAWPLYVTLLCVAALMDLALRRSVGLAFVATVPLLVTRYSFQRYTNAKHTYEQTTRALSLLPEVAGLTALGHSERTAAYVEAVAPELGFDPARTMQLATAARLHHIGHISLHEEAERDGPPDPMQLASVSEEILHETGFLGGLAEIVSECQPGGPPASTLEGAVVRVCSSLDELVEVSVEVDPFAALVAMYAVGHERTVAIAALAVSHRRPSLVADARSSVELIYSVAAAAASHGDH